MSTFPDLRLRRMRSSQNIRDMFDMPMPNASKFMWPVFIIEGNNKKVAIDAMPNQFRYSIDKLAEAIEPVYKSGVKSLMLFGVVENDKKTIDGSYAYSEQGLIQRAICEIRKRFPEIVIFTDVCMCAYTTHGHCGILDSNSDVDNDLSINKLAKIALSHAVAGANGVAPSAMMDGQIRAIRNELDANKYTNTLLMSYSTKFASAMYGPFREAAGSPPGKGDRQGYQGSYANLNNALLESQLDEEEGVDILMVKPAMFYLDIISKIKEQTLLPVAAYNVSGEYSMLHATAEKGWGDLYAMARESIMALSRAGTDIQISYWANQLDRL